MEINGKYEKNSLYGEFKNIVALQGYIHLNTSVMRLPVKVYHSESPYLA
jgi:hypothetical protein